MAHGSEPHNLTDFTCREAAASGRAFFVSEHDLGGAHLPLRALDPRAETPDLRLDIQTPVYISLDLDGLDPAFAPGVSHREPGGPSTRQVLNLIQSLKQPIVGADIVEYNPRCDIGNTTATVAAKLLKEIAGMMIKNRKVP